MGYSTIIAGIFFVATLIVSFYVYADSATRMSNISLQSLQSASSIQLEKIRSSAHIGSILVSGDFSRLYVNITNTGDLKITQDTFSAIDLLITYTDNATGVTQTYWCQFNSSDPSTYRWIVNSTITPNPFPAIIDPLNWDPSKTLSITVELPTPHDIKPGTVGYLKVILPPGTSTAQAFNA